MWQVSQAKIFIFFCTFCAHGYGEGDACWGEMKNVGGKKIKEGREKCREKNIINNEVKRLRNPSLGFNSRRVCVSWREKVVLIHVGSMIYTVCPRSSDPFYIYYIEWVTTSMTRSTPTCITYYLHAGWSWYSCDSGVESCPCALPVLGQSHLP